MPNLEDFLGKSNKPDLSRWEPMFGIYQCKECEEEVEKAFFNADDLVIAWVCSQGHESKIELG